VIQPAFDYLERKLVEHNVQLDLFRACRFFDPAFVAQQLPLPALISDGLMVLKFVSADVKTGMIGELSTYHTLATGSNRVSYIDRVQSCGCCTDLLESVCPPAACHSERL
jgi:hypothetical protein